MSGNREHNLSLAVDDLATLDTKTTQELVDHLLEHLSPYNIESFGIPDLELRQALVLKMSVGPILKTILKRLEWSEDDFDRELSSWEYPENIVGINLEEYKTLLIKVLRHTSDLGLATVDWDTVDQTFPGASGITVDTNRDCKDTMFHDAVDEFVRIYRGKNKSAILRLLGAVEELSV